MSPSEAPSGRSSDPGRDRVRTPDSDSDGPGAGTGRDEGGRRRFADGLGRPGAGPVLGSSYPRRYGRYVGVLGLVILVLLAINVALTKPNGAKGIETGQPIPPFAAPLASGSLNGDVNVATHANEGSAGKTPACEVRGSGVLNVCELYAGRPLVLALFVDAGSCAAVLSEMQALALTYPEVSFAAVAIKGERTALRKLMRKQGLTRVQVGFDSDGVLTGLYRMASCPQVSFVLPGGVVQSPALLQAPSRAEFRARVAELVAAARVRGGGGSSSSASSGSSSEHKPPRSSGAEGSAP